MIKRWVKSLLPRRVLQWHFERRANRRRKEFAGLSTEQVFTKIYYRRRVGCRAGREAAVLLRHWFARRADC